MRKIVHITGRIPNSTTELDIPLKGKSLIITGRNGSGKTYFLTKLHETCAAQKLYLQNDYGEILQEIERLNNTPPIAAQSVRAASEIARLMAIKQKLEETIAPVFDRSNQTEAEAKGNIGIFSFSATRRSSINSTDHIDGLANGLQKLRSPGGLADKLEQHIVNLEARRAMMGGHPDVELAKKIDSFLSRLRRNLKLLMEDESAELVFNLDETSITIRRDGKPDTSFQTLSSGYSAFFCYYSEILLQAEARNLTPEDLHGIVIIDEIEIHLHVSLQRLILPFLIDSFPKIQFILTTHSPFVLTSSSQVVIYDISSNSIIEEDITLYSYSAIVEGLLDTNTKSISLESLTKKLIEVLKSEYSTSSQIKPLLTKLESSYDHLDNRSKVVYEHALNILQDREQKDV
ncbi:AAA family ATPase [Pseudomonas sp. 2hn]|uniref:AAA family ATPase n=1 Tax=Pseudomonas sp. 2hn TaxID=2866626 RepID=UPI001C7DA4F5|nr:AAA family ATPase [Pseudomonas sp. 2hn]QZA52598.1 AAA family ATPase [Pseudomonas sp. 2hn]